MMPTLYAHPFSSYCQKVLTALYENGTPFDYRVLAHDDPKPMQELAALWPLKRFPVLVDAGRTVIEGLPGVDLCRGHSLGAADSGLIRHASSASLA
jgi:hypothetical protein